MKNYYIAVSISENEKYYAYMIKATSSDNLLSKLKIKNIISANICETKKSASEIIKLWNDGYKANGTSLFQFPSF